MLKALFKKQLLEIREIYTPKKYRGQKRKGAVGFIILYAFCLLSVAAAFVGGRLSYFRRAQVFSGRTQESVPSEPTAARTRSGASIRSGSGITRTQHTAESPFSAVITISVSPSARAVKRPACSSNLSFSRSKK